MNQKFSLRDKRILITGASSGIGRTTAEIFSQSGASLILNGRDESRLNETLSICANQSTAIATDLSKTEGVKKLIDAIESPIDGVFLCAGISHESLIKFSNPDDIARVFETNCFSNIRILTELQKSKKIKKGGSIVITASVSAIEFAPRQIRINTISPGLVETPMTEAFLNGEPELCQADKKKYLLGYGQTQDIAYAAQYLLSDASRWVTGTNLVIDGGYTCQK